MRMRAPIIGGPSAASNLSVKSLDHPNEFCKMVKSFYLLAQENPMDSARSNTIQVGSIDVEFLVDADDSDGSVTVFECLVPADAKVPLPHSDDGFEETIYGLEGSCTWTIDGEPHDISRGDSICIGRA